jgi:hypothetical protein
MVRYAVEQTLQSRGFFGRTKDCESAGFRMKSEAQHRHMTRRIDAVRQTIAQRSVRWHSREVGGIMTLER